MAAYTLNQRMKASRRRSYLPEVKLSPTRLGETERRVFISGNKITKRPGGVESVSGITTESDSALEALHPEAVLWYPPALPGRFQSSRRTQGAFLLRRGRRAA